MASSSLWQRFQRHFIHYRDLDFSLDVSRLQFPEDFFEKMQPKIGKAFAAVLPMALEGFDIARFLAGAAAMDERTRVPDVTQNAAMLLALMWYYAGNGKGEKDMVILPYKDRLALFAK